MCSGLPSCKHVIIYVMLLTDYSNVEDYNVWLTEFSVVFGREEKEEKKKVFKNKFCFASLRLVCRVQVFVAASWCGL